MTLSGAGSCFLLLPTCAGRFTHLRADHLSCSSPLVGEGDRSNEWSPKGGAREVRWWGFLLNFQQLDRVRLRKDTPPPFRCAPPRLATFCFAHGPPPRQAGRKKKSHYKTLPVASAFVEMCVHTVYGVSASKVQLSPVHGAKRRAGLFLKSQNQPPLVLEPRFESTKTHHALKMRPITPCTATTSGRAPSAPQGICCSTSVMNSSPSSPGQTL
jgi:hypothetical protein